MKVRYIVLISVLIGALVATYFFRDRLFSPSAVSTWDFVPENAIGVWEFENPVEDWNKFLKTSHWQNLRAIPYFSSVNRSLLRLDSLSGNVGFVDEVLRNGEFLISAHTVSSTDLDYLFYVHIRTPEHQEQFLKIADNYEQTEGYSAGSRTYHGQVINEITDTKKRSTFSFVLIDNHFIGSFTPFLVDDVIRTYQGEDQRFQANHTRAFGLPNLEFDAGNVYLNLEKVASLYGVFFPDRNSGTYQALRSLRGSAFLDANFDSELFYLSGFCLPEPGGFLDIFSGLSSVETSFTGLLPEKAAIVEYQAFDDSRKWHENLRNYLATSQKEQAVVMNAFVEEYEFDLARMVQWIADQLVIVILEPMDDDPSRLLLVATTDEYESLNQLNRLSEKATVQQGDTLYFESYSEERIYLLNIPEFPSKIFGNNYQGFPQVYYCTIEGFVVFSDDIESIKRLIDDRENERTWRQSVSKSEFLNHNLDESNYGVMINTNLSWEVLTGNLNEKLKGDWEKYSRSIRQLELAGLQLSNTGSQDRLYFNIVGRQRQAFGSRQASATRTTELRAMGVDTTVVYGPRVVRNHRTSAFEVIMQDSLNRLTLFGDDGRLLWQIGLDGRIKGQISQVDFYKNRKLQYLFSTDSSLWIVDRNGDSVEGYPVSLDGLNIHGARVIDYDKSRNYRFLLADENGDAYLLNKEGERLDGWNPRKFNSKFSVTPFHVRVRSRDTFIAIMEGGEVIATNRRGETLPGFPLDLDAEIGGDVFVQVRSGFSQTVLHVITQEGELIQFNLAGEIQQRTQMYKPSRDSRFELIRESLGRSYVISRQDLNRLAIVDREDNLLMEKDYFSSEPFDVQYYNFGVGRQIIIVNNAEIGRSLIYDISGDLRTDRVESAHPISMIYYESREIFHVYAASGDSVRVYVMPE